jgi:hypothetical protein
VIRPGGTASRRSPVDLAHDDVERAQDHDRVRELVADNYLA